MEESTLSRLVKAAQAELSFSSAWIVAMKNDDAMYLLDAPAYMPWDTVITNVSYIACWVRMNAETVVRDI